MSTPVGRILPEFPNPLAFPVQGRPFIEAVECTNAGQSYTAKPAEFLGRNARFGFIRAKSTNTGAVSVAISHDGEAFSGVYDDLQAGESFSLDFMDVHSVRVSSSVAGDVALIEAH